MRRHVHNEAPQRSTRKASHPSSHRSPTHRFPDLAHALKAVVLANSFLDASPEADTVLADETGDNAAGNSLRLGDVPGAAATVAKRELTRGPMLQRDKRWCARRGLPAGGSARARVSTAGHRHACTRRIPSPRAFALPRVQAFASLKNMAEFGACVLFRAGRRCHGPGERLCTVHWRQRRLSASALLLKRIWHRRDFARAQRTHAHTAAPPHTPHPTRTCNVWGQLS